MALIRHTLPLLSLFALYAIFYFALTNGLMGLSTSAIEAGVLPDTTEALRTVYTGFAPLDRVLTSLGTFFWPVVEGRNVTLTLHAVAFSGAFGAAWVLVVLEAWREGNKGSVAAFPTIFGVSAQALTFAFAIPLYCGFHLSHAVTAKKPTAATLRISRPVLNAIPFAILIGYGIPSALMMEAPVDADTRQKLIAAWHPWPAYVTFILTVVNFISSSRRKEEGGRATLSALRRVYAFAFATAAVPHVLSLVVSLASVRAPFLFSDEYRAALHPGEVFKVVLPWAKPGLRVGSVAEGVHVFLRWDYLIGTTGVLLWAVSLHATANWEVRRKSGWFGIFVKTVLLVVVSGPVGAAVELMWERDELVMQEAMAAKRQAQGSRKR